MFNLSCRLLGHRRSKYHVRLTSAGWRTRCERCGQVLVRLRKYNDWKVPELSETDLPT